MQCHSYYSLLQGVSSPEDLVERAVELELPWLALTDCDGLYGASFFYKACRERGVHPVLGAEVREGVVLVCENMKGYSTLSQLITEVKKGGVTDELLAAHRGGLFCLVDGDVERYREIYGDRLYGMLTRTWEEGDLERCRRLFESGVPCVVGGNVRYARREEAPLFDVVTCIRHGVTIEESHQLRAGNSERFLRSEEELQELYREFPGVVDRTFDLAKRCEVDLDFSSYRFPKFESEYSLRELCERRCPPDYQEKLDHELALIEKLGLVDYFLIVWDIVEFARRRGIPAQGRGSAANSLVAYLLRITPVDPVKHKLFLGRFIHEGMKTVPDIDLDFAATRASGFPDREDVIQYVYDKYGADHVAMVCTFVTFKKKLATREVEKVMGRVVPELVQGLIGIPRHLSIHVGGMLIASRPLSELVPLEPASMDRRVVCQWDKDMVEDAGLIKVDILSLGMLAVLRDTGVDLSELTYDDPKVYEMIARADTIGLFQVESRAQMQSLPRTRPTNLPELAIQVAIIRPGPLQGNMVQPYIRRRRGREKVTYPHPCLAPVLEETLGVILFQEQVLQVAVAMAGFSQTDAAALRKAMSRKRSLEAMHALRTAFIDGAAAKGVPTNIAADTFEILCGFASYGFCKSHALSFASIAYQSAYLKRYHPAPFLAAILNNQPMGFYSFEVLIQDAKRHGVEILPVDINVSRARSVSHENAVRLGLLMVKGISHESAILIEASQPFASIEDFRTRTRLSPEMLITAGAFESLGNSRRNDLWKGWAPLTPYSHPTLPTQSEWEKLLADYSVLSFSPKWHPLAFLRKPLTDLGYIDSRALRQTSNTTVKIAGLQVCRQKPRTAKGFAFFTLEDEYGLINLVIPPDLFEEHRELLTTASILGIWGKRESQDGVLNVRLKSVQAINPHETGLDVAGRFWF